MGELPVTEVRPARREEEPGHPPPSFAHLAIKTVRNSFFG